MSLTLGNAGSRDHRQYLGVDKATDRNRPWPAGLALLGANGHPSNAASEETVPVRRSRCRLSRWIDPTPLWSLTRFSGGGFRSPAPSFGDSRAVRPDDDLGGSRVCGRSEAGSIAATYIQFTDHR